MKFFQTICLSLALAAGSPLSPIWAQNGQGYFLHTIEKGQSLYSIASMYNLTVQDIVRLNPGADQGIRAGATLKIPQQQQAADGKKQFHTIQPKETLYQLTQKYGVSAQAICDANPGLSANNFRIGQVILIPARTAENKPAAEVAQTAPAQKQQAQQNQQWKEMHRVEKKETIFSICRMYGVEQEDLLALNPELKNGKLKKGKLIFIPYPRSEQKQETAAQPATVPTDAELFSQSRGDIKQIKTVKAAIMLPFMADGSGNKEDQNRMVEYYEGFLMAVDSLKQLGTNIDLYVYDTKGNHSSIQPILSKPELKNMDIIFGPGYPEHVKPLADFAAKNNVRLVIPFTSKENEVFNNPMIYQINTPQSYLYSEVYEHFTRKFTNANVIFLTVDPADKSKADFIKGLKNELRDKHIPFQDLSGDITPEVLATVMAQDKDNIFIPTTGRNTALIRLLPQLTVTMRDNPTYRMLLFGYPEWQTYTHDHLASFFELDTYFYSSFYTNNLFPAAVNFTKSYRKWFSKDMGNTYPKYGMLGFDMGFYFLKGLARFGSELENNLDKVNVTPIQTGLKFERVNNWGGFINRKVFFIHFTREFELIKLDFE